MQQPMDVVNSLKRMTEEKIDEIHTVIPAEIKSFDPSKGQATVQPKMKFYKPNGDALDYPEISGVPVLFPQSYNQNAVIAYPIQKGDGCLLLCTEKSLDEWQFGHETYMNLRFDLTNCVALVGLFKKPPQILAEACNDPSIILLNGSTKMKLKQTEVEITTQTLKINGDVRVNGTLNATGNITAPNLEYR